MRTIRLVLWALVFVVGAATAGVYVGRTFMAPPDQGVAQGLSGAFARAQYHEGGAPFELTNTAGETVRWEDLRGKPAALFFGFTHCPDVCPTALLDASSWLDALGEDADDLQVVFISVDPQRDRPQLLRQYVKAFDERIMGLTGEDDAQMRQIANDYRISYEMVPLSNGDYTINHTADTLLFDRDGNFVDYIAYLAPNMRMNERIASEERARTMEKLRNLLSS